MVSSAQIGIAQDDWEQVWQDYDRRHPAAAKAPAPAPAEDSRATRGRASPAQRHHRSHGAVLALAVCLTLSPLPGVPAANRYPAPAEALASLRSLAPEEAEMPPLTAALSRLAAESSVAACWVMRLAPSATPWAQPCIEPAAP